MLADENHGIRWIGQRAIIQLHHRKTTETRAARQERGIKLHLYVDSRSLTQLRAKGL